MNTAAQILLVLRIEDIESRTLRGQMNRKLAFTVEMKAFIVTQIWDKVNSWVVKQMLSDICKTILVISCLLPHKIDNLNDWNSMNHSSYSLLDCEFLEGKHSIFISDRHIVVSTQKYD